MSIEIGISAVTGSIPAIGEAAASTTAATVAPQIESSFVPLVTIPAEGFIFPPEALPAVNSLSDTKPLGPLSGETFSSDVRIADKKINDLSPIWQMPKQPARNLAEITAINTPESPFFDHSFDPAEEMPATENNFTPEEPITQHDLDMPKIESILDELATIAENSGDFDAVSQDLNIELSGNIVPAELEPLIEFSEKDTVINTILDGSTDTMPQLTVTMPTVEVETIEEQAEVIEIPQEEALQDQIEAVAEEEIDLEEDVLQQKRIEQEEEEVLPPPEEIIYTVQYDANEARKREAKAVIEQLLAEAEATQAATGMPKEDEIAVLGTDVAGRLPQEPSLEAISDITKKKDGSYTGYLIHIAEEEEPFTRENTGDILDAAVKENNAVTDDGSGIIATEEEVEKVLSEGREPVEEPENVSIGDSL